MSSTIFFFFFVPLLSSVLLAINLVLAPHNPYMEKKATFECGFSSFLGQNRTQFSISFFIFALLFLLFDLEILLVYPYLVSAYVNEIYGLSILLLFLTALTLGFAFELGKKALTIDSKQTSPNSESKLDSINNLSNLHISMSSLCNFLNRPSILSSFKSIKKMKFSCSAPLAVDPTDPTDPINRIDIARDKIEKMDNLMEEIEKTITNIDKECEEVVDLFKGEIDRVGEYRASNNQGQMEIHEDKADKYEYIVDGYDGLRYELKTANEKLQSAKIRQEEAEEEAQAELEAQAEAEAQTQTETQTQTEPGTETETETHTNVVTSEPAIDSTDVPSGVPPVPVDGSTIGCAAGSTTGTSDVSSSASADRPMPESTNQDRNLRSVLDIDEFDLFSHLDNTFVQDMLQIIADIPIINLIMFIITIAFAIKSLIR